MFFIFFLCSSNFQNNVSNSLSMLHYVVPLLSILSTLLELPSKTSFQKAPKCTIYRHCFHTVKEKDRIYVCYLMLQNVGSISNKKPNLEFLFSKFDKWKALFSLCNYRLEYRHHKGSLFLKCYGAGHDPPTSFPPLQEILEPHLTLSCLLSYFTGYRNREKYH